MDSLAKFSITPKGVEEIRHRTSKLGLKRRSVLLLLEKQPQSIGQILQRSLFPQSEIMLEIEFLLREGFIGRGLATELVPPGTSSPTRILRLGDEIVISEARFLLTDFIIDHFPAQARELSEELRACYDVDGVRRFLLKIQSRAEKSRPGMMQLLSNVVREINETA